MLRRPTPDVQATGQPRRHHPPGLDPGPAPATTSRTEHDPEPENPSRTPHPRDQPRESGPRTHTDKLIPPALDAFGCPQQVLTDNGKVFTGRFNHPPVEVRFDQICRDNGIEHLLTAPRSPTTTGKIERFHRTMRAEFDTARVFASIAVAQAELDRWVAHYNGDRPHQSLDGATPTERFYAAGGSPVRPAKPAATDRSGSNWVARRVASNGVLCVSWQQISVGVSHAGANVDVHVTDQLLQIWRGPELLKTVTRQSRGEVRKKNASTHDARTGR